MPKIRLCHADGSENKFGLAGKLFTIGRAADNDIVLPDGTSSNYHAVLKMTPSGDFSLTDLGSTNHTRVNGKRITTRDLRGGDRILFGDTLAFYESEISPPEGAEDAAAPSPEFGASTRRLPPRGDTVVAAHPGSETTIEDEEDEEEAAARRQAQREARREKLGKAARRDTPQTRTAPNPDRESEEPRAGGGCLGLIVAVALLAATLGAFVTTASRGLLPPGP